MPLIEFESKSDGCYDSGGGLGNSGGVSVHGMVHRGKIQKGGMVIGGGTQSSREIEGIDDEGERAREGEKR